MQLTYKHTYTYNTYTWKDKKIFFCREDETLIDFQGYTTT